MYCVYSGLERPKWSYVRLSYKLKISSSRRQLVAKQNQRGDFKRLRIRDSLLGEMTHEPVFVVRWSYLDRREMGYEQRV